VETVLLFVLGVVIFVIGLGVSIALHELGHLSTAKLFGVKVTQYMVGFGKTLFSFRRGETEYGVKALPLGGYIAMIGMFPPKKGERVHESSTGFYQQMVQEARTASAETVDDGDEHRAFYRLNPLKRIIVMFAGPFMNLVIAFVLYLIIVCGIGLAVPANVVGSVAACLPASATQTTCAADAAASPAKAGGLKPGDTILSVDGVSTPTWGKAATIFESSPGTPLSVVVDRDGSTRTLTVTPRATKRYVTDGDGNVVKKDGVKQTETVGMIGIGQGTKIEAQPLTVALPVFGEGIAQTAGVIVNLPERMVGVWNAAFGSGERSANSPVGIIGVGRATGEIVSDNQYPVVARVQFVLNILASLNIALFVFNMIPLLPLDGGHIIGAIWEAIKRGWAKVFRRKEPHPVDMARLMPVTYVVVIVLGAMSLLLAYADIVKPISFG
jgi:membrane-associated protease RseP (regulator of RpoE activity)